MSIVSVMQEASAQYGRKVSIIEGSREITYAELWSRITRLSEAFRQIGIEGARPVALLLPGSIDFICCFFASLANNIAVCPLSPDLAPLEIKKLLNALDPCAIILTSKALGEIHKECPELIDNSTVILSEDTAYTGYLGNYYTLNHLYGRSARGKPPLPAADASLAVINYTYRGVGYPLGSMFSHRVYAEGVLSYASVTGLSSRDNVLSLLPVSHFYPLIGSILAPLISGATVIISRNYLPRAIFKVIDNLRITRLTAVPTIYKLLLNEHARCKYNIGSLNCCLTGGAYMSYETQEVIRSHMGLNVIQGYGLSECLVATWNQPDYVYSDTIGRPFRRDVEVRIEGDDGSEKSVGEIGEIAIKSSTLMEGYYKQAVDTQAVLRNGWLYTGDYGLLDSRGLLYFKGHKKNVAKVGGSMVDLKEVEDVLLSHPDVVHARIYPLENDLWGHVVGAEVVARAEGGLSPTGLRNYCIRRISPYKIPKEIRWQQE